MQERSKLISLLLALMTLLLFWPATGFDFLNYDDTDYILNNEVIHDGLTKRGVAWALTSDYASNWHPLTWVSHMVDCGLYGAKPGGHHLTNILLHAANVVLLFLVLQQMTGAAWRSAFAAALFAWHPLHVESVAWVSERKDVLSTFFWLLSLWGYAGYAQSSKAQGPKSKVFYGLALLFFALGLMSKPMVVTLPFVFLLLDFWPLLRIADWSFRTGTLRIADLDTSGEFPNQSTPWSRLIIEKMPFFALAALDCVATFWAQKGGNAVVSSDALPFSVRVSNAMVSYVLYLWKTVWPTDLAVLYPYSHQWTFLPTAGACLLLAVISGAVLWRARQQPYLATGWFWFLGTLVPVIGLVQVGLQFMADRYTYVPLIGIFIMLVWGMSDLADKRPGLRRLLAPVAAGSLVGLMICTWTQLGYWRNSVTLFGRAVEVTHDSILAEYNLGEALARDGDDQAAIAHYLRALAIRPNRVEAWHNSQTEAHYNLGAILARQGKFADAEAQFRAILQDQPGHARAHSALGKVLLGAGRLDEAVAEYRIAARLEPANSEAWRLLGMALAKRGKGSEAVQACREAVRLAPDGPAALADLAWLLATLPGANLRNGPEAVRLAQRACELSGQDPRSLDVLGAAYAEAGQFDEAAAAATKAREVALARGQKDLAAEAANRLELYHAGKCYHQSPAGG